MQSRRFEEDDGDKSDNRGRQECGVKHRWRHDPSDSRQAQSGIGCNEQSRRVPRQTSLSILTAWPDKQRQTPHGSWILGIWIVCFIYASSHVVFNLIRREKNQLGLDAGLS